MVGGANRQTGQRLDSCGAHFGLPIRSRFLQRIKHGRIGEFHHAENLGRTNARLGTAGTQRADQRRQGRGTHSLDAVKSRALHPVIRITQGFNQSSRGQRVGHADFTQETDGLGARRLMVGKPNVEERDVRQDFFQGGLAGERFLPDKPDEAGHGGTAHGAQCALRFGAHRVIFAEQAIRPRLGPHPLVGNFV